MGIVETFTKRMKKLKNQGKIDVYKYDDIPKSLRIQIVHIWVEAIGTEKEEWDFIHNTLSKELGVFNLAEDYYYSFEKCKYYFLNSDVNGAIDIIELTFKYIDRVIRNYNLNKKINKDIKQKPNDAINELNYRFREHCVGYELINGEIKRIDNQYLHKMSIRPTINLLSEEGFGGANNEFLKAHKHFREGNFKEAIAESLKSFESTMKTICDKKSIVYDKDNDTASSLILILISNGIIPSYLHSHFTGLRTTLESGLPTVRNRTSGHGQGSSTVTIPDFFASYAINLAATNILFLVNAYKKS